MERVRVAETDFGTPNSAPARMMTVLGKSPRPAGGDDGEGLATRLGNQIGKNAWPSADHPLAHDTPQT